MKDVKIRYKDLSSKQKTAISTLKEWIHTMYTNDVDKVNLQALRSSINGPSQSAARAYAPVGFHK